jgi:hypothetical protein
MPEEYWVIDKGKMAQKLFFCVPRNFSSENEYKLIRIWFLLFFSNLSYWIAPHCTSSLCISLFLCMSHIYSE